jgi:hypothetical protein
MELYYTWIWWWN